MQYTTLSLHSNKKTVGCFSTLFFTYKFAYATSLYILKQEAFLNPYLLRTKKEKLYTLFLIIILSDATCSQIPGETWLRATEQECCEYYILLMLIFPLALRMRRNIICNILHYCNDDIKSLCDRWYAYYQSKHQIINYIINYS